MLQAETKAGHSQEARRVDAGRHHQLIGRKMAAARVYARQTAGTQRKAGDLAGRDEPRSEQLRVIEQPVGDPHRIEVSVDGGEIRARDLAW